MTHLPAELLHKIISAFVADSQQRPKDNSYLPKDFLLPLLRVCKSWHPIAEYYLYNSTSLGNSFFGRGNAEAEFGRTPAYAKRRAYVIAEHLLSTLRDHPRLARLVKTLRLGIVDSSEVFSYTNDGEEVVGLGVKLMWMQTCIAILKLCTEVEHVEIRGYWFDRLDILFDALGQKSGSIRSFSIDGETLARIGHNDYPSLMDLLFKTMRRWPNLVRVSAQGLFLRQRNVLSRDNDTEADHLRVCSQTEEFHFDLRYPSEDSTSLCAEELCALRALCPNLKKLSAPLAGPEIELDAEDIHAIAQCIRAWAPTLEYAEFVNHSEGNLQGSQPILDSLSTCAHLKELHITRIPWNANSLLHLPDLERLVCEWDDAELSNIAASLDDARKFPALRIIQVHASVWPRPKCFERDLMTACCRRQIHLSKFTFRAPSRDQLVDDAPSDISSKINQSCFGL